MIIIYKELMHTQQSFRCKRCRFILIVFKSCWHCDSACLFGIPLNHGLTENHLKPGMKVTKRTKTLQKKQLQDFGVDWLSLFFTTTFIVFLSEYVVNTHGNANSTENLQTRKEGMYQNPNAHSNSAWHTKMERNSQDYPATSSAYDIPKFKLYINENRMNRNLNESKFDAITEKERIQSFTTHQFRNSNQYII